jgi:hypothetical protein
MERDAIVQYISETFDGLDIAEHEGDFYFMYDPDRNLEPKQKQPFATLVTGDRHDTFSNLDRPSVYRLNFGLSKQTFQSLFAAGETTDIDFTALDQVMPHPVYGRMYWACVLNPSDPTWERVRSWLAEAYDQSVQRLRRRQPSH